jgi:hypothetical protein
MDLRVVITNEHDEIIADEVIYQDGSDLEGAKAIVDYMKDNFDVEE